MQKLTGYELEFTAGNGGGPGATYETAMLTEWPIKKFGASTLPPVCARRWARGFWLYLRAVRLRSRLSSDCNTIVRLNSAQVGMIEGDG